MCLRRKDVRALLTGAFLLVLAGGKPAAARSETPGVEEAARETWIVRLAEPSLAGNRGELAGLAPTHARTLGRRRLDPASPASSAYLAFLDRRHDRVRAAIEARCGRAVPVQRRFRAAVNGFTVRLDEDEAAAVRRLPGVRDVVRDGANAPDTDRGPRFLGADQIWLGGSTGVDTRGEGVVIGILDTGINGGHPSFADPGPVDGHSHTNPLGDGVFLGRCALPPWHPRHYPHCNNKLIGAYSFSIDDDPEDEDGHGSHVASTAAGNRLAVSKLVGGTALEYPISGVAPHANLVMYEVCAPAPELCRDSASIAAVDAAILSGVVDVLNFSIGTTGGAWTDVVAAAFLDATEAGIFVAQSAGNGGPQPATVNAGNSAWTTTVASQTLDRVYWNELVGLVANGGLADIQGYSVSAGTGGAFEIVYAGDVDVGGQRHPLCGKGASVLPPDGSSNPFPAGLFTGKIVVCDRGGYARVEKGYNVAQAGAAGFILANQASTGDEIFADDHYLPAIHITHADGVALKAWLGAGGPAFTGEITSAARSIDSAFGDILATDSSRGPHPDAPGLIKPDLSAPGTSILAAGASGSGGDEVEMLSGTSQASPHVAGAAALLRALHPDWSAPEIKSALMLMAKAVVRKEDGVAAGDPFDRGSGRVDVGAASRSLLVMDETAARFLAANPASGGDPTSLNLASLANPACEGTCSWDRSFRNVSGGPVELEVRQTGGAPDLILAAAPTAFTLADGASQEIRLTARVRACPAGGCGPSADWRFGELELRVLSSPLGSGADLDLHLPVAIVPAPEPGLLLGMCSALGSLAALGRWRAPRD